MSPVTEILSIFDPTVTRTDGWEVSTKRLSEFLPMLRASENGASLTLPFHGTALSLLRASIWQSFEPVRGRDYWHPQFPFHARPAPSVAGETIQWRIDDRPPQTIDLGLAPLEIPLAENLPSGPHRMELTALTRGRSCFRGFRALTAPFGQITAPVSAEKSDYLNDLRVHLHHSGERFDSRLARNALTGRMELWGLPPGTYDLHLEAVGWRPLHIPEIVVRPGETTTLPPIHLAAEPLRRQPWPTGFHRPGRCRLVQFGHLDTWCQRNAEYLRTIVELTNLFHPDLLLIGNEVNWQYVTGALNGLRAPFLITSGNHGIPGFPDYFGGDLETARIDTVFFASYSRCWQADPADLRAAFNTPAARTAAYRVLQGVEGDLPAALAHELGVDLYACGHGFTAEKPADADWTHLGKEFHLIDIDLATRRATITNVTNTGKRTLDKYPLSRETPTPPVRFDSPRRAVAFNPLWCPVPDCQLVFRLPPGRYRPSIGTLAAHTPIAGTKEVAVVVDLDLPPQTPVAVEILDA